jgi:hypothetical protein
LYIARSNLSAFDVTEMIAYVGVDEITGSTLPTFPPEGSAIYYFLIRTVNMNNTHFSFSYHGNFHCGKNINCNGKLILLEPNGDQIQITSNNNNWLFNSYPNSVYSGSNCLRLKGLRNNSWTNNLFKFS